MARILVQGKELLEEAKQGAFSESFTSKNGEVFTNFKGNLCYIAKSAREDFANCKISELAVVEQQLKDGASILCLQKGWEEQVHPTKQGNWH